MATFTTSNGKSFNIGIGTYLDTDPAKKELMKFVRTTKNDKNYTVTLDVKLNKDGSYKEITTIKNQFKQLAQVTDEFNANGQKVNTTVTRVSDNLGQLTIATHKQQQAQQSLNNQVKASKSVFQDFTDTFLKMAKFNTINIIYDSLTKSMSNAITITKEFNDATTELRKVSDLEGDSLKAYAQDLAEYGAEVGRTMTDMVNSATVFKRTGASDEEAKNLAKVAEMYRNVADNEISSAEAASFLVSQMKAFNIEANNSIHIIDSVNAVANAYAVNTNDLQTALAKSAAAMATAGNTYEETIALVEAGTAVMQGQAGTVGNGLRTIAINIANLATKSDEFIAANGKVSISLKDEQGEIRSTYEVLNDLSKNWDDLSRSEQNSIATTLAGKHKIPRLAHYKPIELLGVSY